MGHLPKLTGAKHRALEARRGRVVSEFVCEKDYSREKWPSLRKNYASHNIFQIFFSPVAKCSSFNPWEILIYPAVSLI